MPDAVIVEGLRTAAGQRYGSLSGWHPAELAVQTLTARQEPAVSIPWASAT